MRIAMSNRVLMPACIEWLVFMTHSMHRGVRHTGTEAALAVMIAMNEIHVEMLGVEAQQRRLQGGQKKKDVMQAALVEALEKLQSQIALLHVSVVPRMKPQQIRSSVCLLSPVSAGRA